MLTVPVEHRKYSVEDFKQFLEHPVRVRLTIQVPHRILLELINSSKIVKSILNSLSLK